MASRMMAMVRTPPAGTPAAPTLDAVAVTLGDSNAGGAQRVAETAAMTYYKPQPLCLGA